MQREMQEITAQYDTKNLCDRDFGVVAQDSYRLKRKVEMFQWQEVFHQAKN